jgi:hypothetical protein
MAVNEKEVNMPAFDHCHDQVVRALQKDGWRVVRSPYTIYLPYRYVFADLLVRRENNGNVDQIAIVEIKCFSSNTNTTTELYTAIGRILCIALCSAK